MVVASGACGVKGRLSRRPAAHRLFFPRGRTRYSHAARPGPPSKSVGSPHVYVWIVKAHGFVEFFLTLTINQAKSTEFLEPCIVTLGHVNSKF